MVGRRWRIAVVSAAALLAATCGGTPSGSSQLSVPSADASPAGEAPSGSRSAAPTDSLVPAPTLGDLDCEGGATSGATDYVAGATGGNPDLEAATRELRSVRPTDEVAIEEFRSSVIREGKTIFVGTWFTSATGGWLLSEITACGDFRALPPMGLVRDAIVEVLVDGVRVRGGRSVLEDSIMFEQLLNRGDTFFIVEGPVAADGRDWYLGRSLIGNSEPGPFGWVAAADRDGTPWLEDVESSNCPSLPDGATRFGVLPVELLVHCYGQAELAFKLDATVYCLDDAARQVEPAWFGAGCGELSGDACGTCGLPIVADPDLGVAIPDQAAGRWSFGGHFDDPAAETCAPAGPPAGDSPVPQYVVHLCRMTFALTSLTRIGDAEE